MHLDFTKTFNTQGQPCLHMFHRYDDEEDDFIMMIHDDDAAIGYDDDGNCSVHY